MWDAHIICRFSTQDREEASIDRQKKQCLEVAEKLGCNPGKIKVIANDNLSGGLPWDKRIDLQELERDIKGGQCHKVIVYRFDRLARDFEVSGKLLNLLSHYEIELYDESGKLDYLTASGQAFFGMKAVFAGFERAMIKERTLAGKKQKAKNGYYVGGILPLGYILDHDKYLPNGEINPSYKKLKPYLPHAEVVKEIFHRIKTDCISPMSLSLAFKKEGKVIPEFDPEFISNMKPLSSIKRAKKVAGGYHITPDFIESVATNPVYIGYWNWGEVKRPNNHQPLIDEDTFLSVQERLKEEKRHPRKGKAAYSEPLPLTGLLYCIDHGDKSPVYYKSSKQRYQCSSLYSRGEDSRTHFNVRSYVIDKPVEEFLIKQCSYDGYTAEVINKIEKDRNQQINNAANLLKIKRGIEKEIETLRGNLAYISNEEEVIMIIEEINKRKQQIQNLQCKDKKTSDTLTMKELNLIQDFLANLYSYWGSIPNGLKNRFLRLIIDHIDISYPQEEKFINLTIHWKTSVIQSIQIEYSRRNYFERWTDTEDEILKSKWALSTKREIINSLPNRSWGAIKNRCKHLKLKRQVDKRSKSKMSCIPWSPREEELVREYYEGNLYLNDVISNTGRTANAIRERGRVLRLTDNRVKAKIEWMVAGSGSFKDICPGLCPKLPVLLSG